MAAVGYTGDGGDGSDPTMFRRVSYSHLPPPGPYSPLLNAQAHSHADLEKQELHLDIVKNKHIK